jgi:hypothetical protein
VEHRDGRDLIPATAGAARKAFTARAIRTRRIASTEYDKDKTE